MSAETSTRTHPRTGLWVFLAVIALVAGLIVMSQVQAQRARAVQVDELYCTLSGVSVYDRGPETGRTCFDLMTD